MNLKEQITRYIPFNEQEKKDKELMLKYIDTFDDVLTRNNEMCHFVASAWITNKERTKILMIYYNMYKSWAEIGGHVDGNDNLLQVAMKETKEETGISSIKPVSEDVFAIHILTVNGHIKRGKFVSSHLHLDCNFLFEADENEELKIKEDENSDVKWIDIDKVVDITSEEHMKPIYKKMNEKLQRL